MNGKMKMVAEQRTREKDRPVLDMAKLLVYGGSNARGNKIEPARTSARNKEAMLELASYLSTKVQRFAVSRHILCLKAFLEYLNEPERAFGDIDKRLMQEVVAKIKEGKSEDSSRRVLLSLKVAYKHWFGEDVSYPSQVDWIKTTLKAAHTKLPEDLLSEDEVLRLIEASTSVRDRAIIALLWDAGIRIGELTT